MMAPLVYNSSCTLVIVLTQLTNTSMNARSTKSLTCFPELSILGIAKLALDVHMHAELRKSSRSLFRSSSKRQLSHQSTRPKAPPSIGVDISLWFSAWIPMTAATGGRINRGKMLMTSPQSPHTQGRSCSHDPLQQLGGPPHPGRSTKTCRQISR
ncbi:hypothetical protein IW262DRAFT_277588 [Armillaria fumosa]|nr:hypothetical protein IW262DRAFT_277588 [Armillaria fumosa]